MKKLIHFVLVLAVLLSVYFLGGLVADKQQLQNNLIRMHILANSDGAIDQDNKLVVRDAVVAYLDEKMQGISTVEQAKVFLLSHMTEIENIANSALVSLNAGYQAVASLRQEAFDCRDYDTFSLPSGIYEALKIELGEAKGKNWWCVAFPSLCIPATSADFQDMAIEAGLQRDVVNTVSSENRYEIRFFFLDCLGKIENFFHFS